MLRTGWAQSCRNFAWTTSEVRQFRTFTAKQRCSSLLFMLKSNKNLEPVSLWVPNLHNRGKGNKVSLSKPFPTGRERHGEKRRRCACKHFIQQNCSFWNNLNILPEWAWREDIQGEHYFRPKGRRFIFSESCNSLVNPCFSWLFVIY